MMKENKSLIIVTISTIAFGIISKCFVGIPYMSLSHFDLYFVISFILWGPLFCFFICCWKNCKYRERQSYKGELPWPYLWNDCFMC